MVRSWLRLGRGGAPRGRALAVAATAGAVAVVAWVGVPSAAASSVQYAKLPAPGANTAWFGAAVAVSGDSALIGAPLDNAPGYHSGSASIWVRSGDVWSAQAGLVHPTGRPGDRFGSSVALDGDTALVGAPHDDAGPRTPDAGSVSVFVRSGQTWTRQATLTASDAEEFDYFGRSVAVQGNVAVIGAPYAEDNRGVAYVFTRAGRTWTQRAVLAASDGRLGEFFGSAVAIDQGSVVVGAPEHAIGRAAYVGAAYVFGQSATRWVQQAELTASDGATFDGFGAAVDISGDTALVGAPGDSAPSLPGAGSAYVFSRSGSGWTEQAHVLASDAGQYDAFGAAVAMQGATAVIGAPNHRVGIFDRAGEADVFGRSGSSWLQRERLIARDNPDAASYGWAVALDGSTLLIGAIDDMDLSGGAYVYWR